MKHPIITNATKNAQLPESVEAGKYGDNRIASIDKTKGAVVQAIQQLKY